MHDVTVEAMTDHYKRWSSVDRLRIMLFWTMQIKAALTSKETWSIKPVEITVAEIDLPYKEIANEIHSPVAHTVKQPEKSIPADPESKKTKLSEQMKKADEQILAMLGV